MYSFPSVFLPVFFFFFAKLHKSITLKIRHTLDSKLLKIFRVNVMYSGWFLVRSEVYAIWELLQVKDYAVLNTKSGSKVLKPRFLQLHSTYLAGGVSVAYSHMILLASSSWAF
jgi:hypothetical protein